MTTNKKDTEKPQTANKQFGVMAAERLRLNIFRKLKVRTSIEAYRLKSATNAKLPNRYVKFRSNSFATFFRKVESKRFKKETQ